MTDTYGIALSGMNAYATRLGVSANNVANAQTPDYKPQEVTQQSVPDGGVQTTVGDSANDSYQTYQPDSANANSQGFVSMPNVDYASEAVEQRMDVAGYKANAAVIKTLSAMDKDLLNITA